jgi:hypothetical protein
VWAHRQPASHPHHHHLHTPAARSLARSLEPIRFSVRPTKKISGGARRGPNLPLPAAVAVRSVAAIRARAVACRCPGQPPIHAAPVLGPTPQYRRRTPPASAARSSPLLNLTSSFAATRRDANPSITIQIFGSRKTFPHRRRPRHDVRVRPLCSFGGEETRNRVTRGHLPFECK